MNAYEPGTVANATVRGVPNVRVMRVDNDYYPWTAADSHRQREGEVTDVRPLVVLDLEDPVATVGYLKEATDGFDKAAHGMDAWIGRGPIRQVWAQIEAQTKPPRIPEPGLWGVVEAAWDSKQPVGIPRAEWVRTKGNEWRSCISNVAVRWEDLIDPTLVRPGIEDGAS